MSHPENGFEGICWQNPTKRVIRLSLGKLLVNLLQVARRANTPLISYQMASSTHHVFFGAWVQIPPSTVVNVFRLSPCRT